MKESTDYLSIEQIPVWYWEDDNETGEKIKQVLDRFCNVDITEFPFIGEQLYAIEEGWA